MNFFQLAIFCTLIIHKIEENIPLCSPISALSLAFQLQKKSFWLNCFRQNLLLIAKASSIFSSLRSFNFYRNSLTEQICVNILRKQGWLSFYVMIKEPHGSVAAWPQIKFMFTLIMAAWPHSRKVLFSENILIIS